MEVEKRLIIDASLLGALHEGKVYQSSDTHKALMRVMFLPFDSLACVLAEIGRMLSQYDINALWNICEDGRHAYMHCLNLGSAESGIYVTEQDYCYVIAFQQ